MPGYQHFHLPPPYRALATLGARGLAWEWLRRNASFRELWADAPPLARRANAAVLATLARSRRPIVDIALHPMAKRWAPWGLTFRGIARHTGDQPARVFAADRLGARHRSDADHDRAPRTLGAGDR